MQPLISTRRLILAQKAVRSADHVLAYAAPATINEMINELTKLIPGVVLGNVVDTPEVALAKEYAAYSLVNERLDHEVVRSASDIVLLDHGVPLVNYYYVY